MEALASGTPVVALRSPALEELIDDGRTGALIDDPARLTEGLARVAGVSPEACRAAAAARCSIARTTREYLATYERLAFDARCARRSAPGAESTSAAEA